MLTGVVMRGKVLTVIAITLAAVGLSACFPSYLTSRPAAEIFVTDEAGVPLEGAKVTLGTTKRYGLGGPLTLQDFMTDHEGKVELDAEHDWEIQVLLPDGDVSYSWALCLSKPGYEAVPMVRVDFGEPIKVAMYASAVSSDCEWHHPDSGSTPRVKEREARWIEVAGGQWESYLGLALFMDEEIRAAMEASARQQGVKLHSWSEYRFQYQARGDAVGPSSYFFIHAICRAPAGFDLNGAFYSEPDESACFFDTTYTRQVSTTQDFWGFGPLQVVAGG
jgi:hypothetical protein